MNSFKNFQHRRFISKEGEILNGDFILEEGLTIRFKNGYLNDAEDEEGNLLPALMTADSSHIEHWQNGVIHCEKEPAVIDAVDGYEEWWLNGRQVEENQVPNHSTK